MKKNILLNLISILLFSSFVFAQFTPGFIPPGIPTAGGDGSSDGRYCEGVQRSTLESVYQLYLTRETLQTEVIDLLNTENYDLTDDEFLELFNGFQAIFVALQDVQLEDLQSTILLLSSCFEDAADLYNLKLDVFCPQVNTTDTSNLFGLSYQAKLIADSIENKSTVGANLNLLNNVDIDLGIFDLVSGLYSSCGENLSVEVDSEEEEDDSIPGFCTTPPTAPISRFLWKPISEGDGKLVILTNPESINTVDSEEIRSGPASNAYCSTNRASRSGAGYGNNVVVQIQTLADYRIVIIPDGSQRYDCQGSLEACGLENYTEEEALDAVRKFKKSKRKLRKAQQADDRKKIRKFKKRVKRFRPLNKLFKNIIN